MSPPVHVRVGAWLYTRRTHHMTPAARRQGPFRGATYIVSNAREIIRADRPQYDSPLLRLGRRLPWWSTWIIPGAFALKWGAPAILWAAWLAWTALVTLPLAVALAATLTVAD